MEKKEDFVVKVMIHFEDKCEEILLNTDSFVIGRGATAEVRIEDGHISRNHSRILVENSKVSVMDLGSSNGTWLNNEKIEAKKKVELNVGDKLSFGKKLNFYVTVELNLVSARVAQVSNSEKTLLHAANGSLPLPIQISNERSKKLSIVQDLEKSEAKSDIIEQIKNLMNKGSLELIEKAQKEASEILRDVESQVVSRKKDVDDEIEKKYLELKDDEEKSLKRIVQRELESDDKCKRMDESIRQCHERIESLKSEETSLLEKLEDVKQETVVEVDKISKMREEIWDEERKISEKKKLLLDEEKAIKEKIELELDDFERMKEEVEGEIREIEKEKSSLLDFRTGLLSEIEACRNDKSELIEGIKTLKENTRIINEEIHEATLTKSQIELECNKLKNEQSLLKYEMELFKKEQILTQRSNEQYRNELLEFEEKLKSRDEESKKVIEEATLKSQEIIRNAHDEYEIIKRESDGLKSENEKLNSEIEKRNSNSKKEIEKQRKNSQLECEKIISEAKKNAEEISLKVNYDYEQQLSRAREKSDQIISEANNYAASSKAKSDQMLADLKKEVLQRQNESIRTFTEMNEKKKILEQELNDLRSDWTLRSSEIENEYKKKLINLDGEYEKRDSKLKADYSLKKSELEAELSQEKDRMLAEAQDSICELKNKSNLELKEIKNKHQAMLAQMTEVEQHKIKEYRIQVENDWISLRNNRSKEMANMIEALVKTEMNKIRAKTIDNSFIKSFGHELRGYVVDIMNGDNKAGSEKLQALLKTSEDAKSKEKAFVRKIKLVSGLSVVFISLLFLFPEVITIPKDMFNSLISDKENIEMKEYVSEKIAQAKEKITFSPPTDAQLRGSYYESVLYTTDFVNKRSQKSIQDKWILELNDFFIYKLEVKDTVIITFISLEATLITDLQKLKSQIDPASPDSGIEKMRLREMEFKEKLGKLFQDIEKVSKFYQFSEKFWEPVFK